MTRPTIVIPFAPAERELPVKSSARFVACLATFVLIVFAWLGFTYLMRDTGLLRDLLGWGLFGVLVAGFGLKSLAQRNG